MQGIASNEVNPILPPEVIFNHLLPFLDRATFDDCILLNREIYRLSRQLLPPWPTEAKIQLPQEISCIDTSHLAIACGCQTGQLILVLRQNGKTVELKTAGEVAVTAITFSVDAKQLAIGRVDGSIQVLHFLNENEGVTSKSPTASYSLPCVPSCVTFNGRHTTPVHSLVFFGKNQQFLVSASHHDPVCFWQTANGGRSGESKKTTRDFQLWPCLQMKRCWWESTGVVPYTSTTFRMIAWRNTEH